MLKEQVSVMSLKNTMYKYFVDCMHEKNWSTKIYG